MAQVSVSDERFQSLSEIARQRGMTPESMIAALIELIEREDQLAFWCAGIVENIQRQMNETEQADRHLSPDEFFAELDAANLQPFH